MRRAGCSRIRITIEAYRRTEQAYVLQLPAPACLEGPDEFDKVEKSPRIHVFSMDDGLRKRIGRLVGKRVRVSGAPFGEHTAHHHAPIVMRIGTIEAVSRAVSRALCSTSEAT